MDITRMLYEYPDIEEKVSRLRKEIILINEDKYSMASSSVVSAVGKAKPANSDDAMCRAIESCDKQIARKQLEVDKLIRCKDSIERGFAEIERSDQEIIRLKYFECKSGDEIAKLLCIRTEHLYNRITCIKKRLQEIITECEKM
jgi:hypothetical protein